MEISDKAKKGLIGIFTVVLIGVSSHYVSSYISRIFGNREGNLNYDKTKLNLLIYKAINSKNNLEMNQYSDSCMQFCKNCNASELDSLNRFFALTIKERKDFFNDIVKSLKDTNKIDTAAILMPTTKNELVEICRITGMNYLDFMKIYYAKIIEVHEKQKTMSDSNSVKFINRYISSTKRGDTIIQSIYRNIFPIKE
jgi:ferritin